MTELKQCNKCHEWKPHTNKYFRVRTRWTEHTCRICINEAANAKRRTSETKPQNRVDSEGFKVCGECGERKPYTAEFFHKRGEKRLTSHCITCRNQHNREYSKSEVIRPRRALNMRRWRQSNPDRSRENQRRWRENNPEKSIANQQRYRERHLQVIRLKRRAYEAKRRALTRRAGGVYTASDIALIYRSQRGLCWWCGESVGNTYHIDHRIPLSRGGSNAPENLCITCPDCNLSKHDKLPGEWNGRLL